MIALALLCLLLSAEMLSVRVSNKAPVKSFIKNEDPVYVEEIFADEASNTTSLSEDDVPPKEIPDDDAPPVEFAEDTSLHPSITTRKTKGIGSSSARLTNKTRTAAFANIATISPQRNPRKLMAMGALLKQQLTELREKNRIAFENSMKRRKDRSYHLKWALFLIPLSVLVAYAIFVIVKRRRYSLQMETSATSISMQEQRRTPSAELRKMNWTTKRIPRPQPVISDHFDKKKFTDKGPLVLTKELKGDVKFATLPSHEIVRVEFDDKLNEIVQIGSSVEVYPKEDQTHQSNVKSKLKKDLETSKALPLDRTQLKSVKDTRSKLEEIKEMKTEPASTSIADLQSAPAEEPLSNGRSARTPSNRN
ncbi:unnamed protein product [Cylicocyclus nassatus]|uniref:Uncharacterized protein n=1 Tax=Cylicocyclus nassatus TaxID=53992 RepID=A0AA36GIG6_CYLNA|nr:unnamed protein product [Cylicocyclus nassatus]